MHGSKPDQTRASPHPLDTVGAESCSLRQYLDIPANRPDAASPDAQPEPVPHRRPTITLGGRRQAERQQSRIASIANSDRPATPSHAPQADPAPGVPFVFDAGFVLSTLWRYRTPVLASAILFGIIGGMATLALPRKYTAYASLYFDPQRFAAEFLNDDKSVSPEILNATIDSQAKIITSSAVLREVVTDLNLSTDPALLPRSLGDAEADANVVMSNLARAIKVKREDGTFVLQVAVEGGEPRRAAEIANALVNAYVADERSSNEEAFGNQNNGLAGRLDRLRDAVIAAEAAARDYRASNDLYSVGGDLIVDKRLQSLDDQLVDAQRKTIQAKAQLDSVSKLGVENLLLPEAAGDSGGSRNLADLRAQFATLSASVSSLVQQLGPRHPQLLAAQASLDNLRLQIKGELDRMVAVARSNHKAAQDEETELVKEINIQKASQAANSPSLIELSELERKAKAARDIYEAVLERSETTSTRQGLYESKFRVITKASPPLVADGPSRKVLLLAGAFGGALAGLGLALLVALGLRMRSRLTGDLS